MRILGFSKKGDKLAAVNKDELFSTFRPPRKDRDWAVEEVVQIVYKPRTKEREILGVARIIRKQLKDPAKDFDYFYGGGYGARVKNTPDIITPEEAKEDGFVGMHGGGDIEKMRKYFYETYGYPKYQDPINRLVLYWIEQK